MLSGGERCKVSLAALICSKCSLLLLDEPTNYLDIYVLEALENMLRSYDGTLILVSHDRAFRDNVTNRQIVLQDGKVLLPKPKTAKSTNRGAEITLLEMKLNTLLMQKKGLDEKKQAVLEAQMNAVQDEIAALKQS